jgi:hypothetical protein
MKIIVQNSIINAEAMSGCVATISNVEAQRLISKSPSLAVYCDAYCSPEKVVDKRRIFEPDCTVDKYFIPLAHYKAVRTLEENRDLFFDLCNEVVTSIRAELLRLNSPVQGDDVIYGLDFRKVSTKASLISLFPGADGEVYALDSDGDVDALSMRALCGEIRIADLLLLQEEITKLGRD